MTDIAVKRALRLVILGHVDHGKSTLIGRLLHDTGSLPDGKVEAIEEMSRRRGMGFEWSFALDALQEERDQGITIDTTQVWFKSALRPYVVIDAPGHTEFLKNMITGASTAEAALLLVDVAEGALQQSRRHAFLLTLLGVRQVAVAVNKMDKVGYDQGRFDAVVAEIGAYLRDIGIAVGPIIPISARHGDNVATSSPHMPWYAGPTVLEALDGFVAAAQVPDQALRLPVQDVYKIDDRRIIAGRVESGEVRVGDTLVFLPGGKSAQVTALVGWNEDAPRSTAAVGQSVGLTLDRPIFVERGHIAAHRDRAPVEARRLRVRLFWLADEPLRPGSTYRFHLTTGEYRVTVDHIETLINIDDLTTAPADSVARNGIADVVLVSQSPIPVDLFSDLSRTGRAVLCAGPEVVGGCTVQAVLPLPDTLSDVARPLQAADHPVSLVERRTANGHSGGILWLTGLSGAGKSTLAMALERTLFDQGWQVFVLDGDGLRQGLTRDLGFSPADRAENIRRTAEVARLFAEAGVVVITALISPARADRADARGIGGVYFHEVHVKADLSSCEARDPKGLYKRARAGELPSFTGIGAPYEEPVTPELVIETDRVTVDAALDRLVTYAHHVFRDVEHRLNGSR